MREIESGGRGPPASRGNILVVEDNASSASLFDLLLRAAGFAVEWAPDAAAARRAIAARSPDLILLDVHLPRVDGITFARELKADPAHRQISIVLVTGYGVADARFSGLGDLCQGYLTKPIDTRTFASTIAGYLAKRGQAGQ